MMSDDAEQDRLDRLAETLAKIAREEAGEEAFGVLGAATFLAALESGFNELQANQIILESAEDNYARARARAKQ